MTMNSLPNESLENSMFRKLLCACHCFLPVHFNSVHSDSTEQALLAFSKAGKPHKYHIQLLYVYTLPIWFLDNCLQLVDTVKIQPISVNGIFQDPESCISGQFKELLILHSILLQLLLEDHSDLFLFLIFLVQWLCPYLLWSFFIINIIRIRKYSGHY